MAQQKVARVAHVLDLSESVRLLELEPLESLDFVGGQYIIVNSGLELPDGKLAKRAYSFLSADARQERVVIAVKRIGPASNWLHARTIGDEVPFSGPWGKFLADDARPRRTLVLATDTAITAALGLVRSRAFEPQLPSAELVWLVEDAHYFLPDAFVRAALPSSLRYQRQLLPSVGDGARVAAAIAVATAVTEQAGGFDSVFLAGDGATIYPVRDALQAGEARLESFFNNPAKKSA